VTLSTFLQPGWLVVLLLWSFAILSAAQLTVRLIRAYSVRLTALASAVLSVLALVVSLVYDLAVGSQPSLSTRVEWAPLAMVLMGLAGFGVARWVLRYKRLRGQVVAGVMVAVLDPHLLVLIAR
jgi:hypothetical protein